MAMYPCVKLLRPLPRTHFGAGVPMGREPLSKSADSGFNHVVWDPNEPGVNCLPDHTLLFGAQVNCHECLQDYFFIFATPNAIGKTGDVRPSPCLPPAAGPALRSRTRGSCIFVSCRRAWPGIR